MSIKMPPAYFLRLYRKDALNAAKDLGYGKEVIEAIRNAETKDEISRIMTSARMKMK